MSAISSQCPSIEISFTFEIQAKLSSSLSSNSQTYQLATAKNLKEQYLCSLRNSGQFNRIFATCVHARPTEFNSKEEIADYDEVVIGGKKVCWIDKRDDEGNISRAS